MVNSRTINQLTLIWHTRSKSKLKCVSSHITAVTLKEVYQMCITNYPLEIFYVLEVALIAMVITKPDYVPFTSLIYAIYAQGVLYYLFGTDT